MKARSLPCYTIVALALGTVFLHNSFGDVLINLDATSLPQGPLPTWVNTGTLPGNFTSAGTVTPDVTNILSGTGVSFIGGTTGANGTHYLGPIAPPAVTGTNSRTIEAWIYNPTLQPEEVVFAWGRRNGAPDGSNVSFNHGTDPAFGAVGHWGAPDIGWNGISNIVSTRWTFIAYTYDTTITNVKVFKDGQIVNTETPVPPLNTHSLSTASPPTPLPFRVARQNGGTGTPSGTGVGQLYIGRVRVHDVPLSPATIQANFEAEKCAFGLCDTDGDGIPDYYERLNGMDPNVNDAGGDVDNDGATNLQEYQLGTSATNPDTDGDGVQDGAEINRMDGGNPAPTNPLLADTDGDTLSDGVETDTGVYVSAANTGSDPLKYDTDGDGFADGLEVRRNSDPTNPNIAIATPLINLDATALPLGTLTTWPNTGILPGDFGARSNTPAVTLVQNIRGVTLDGANPTGGFYVGPNTPDYVTGGNGRTVEAWIFNPTAAPEETIFSWGRRGGTPDGSNMSFNHGTDPAFGAVGHWGGGPDIGWGAASNVVQGRWTHVAYTYHPVTFAKIAYSDGRQANIETNAGPLVTARTILNGTNILSFLIGSQVEANGTPTPNLRGALTIARIRVYEAPLTAEVISNKFAIEAEEFGQDDRDGDGLPTWYERNYPTFLNPTDPADAALDQDNDGLTNLEEYQAGTAPNNPDTDGDGLSDTAEIRRMDGGNPAPTNPLRADTDQDGLSDAVETDTGTYVSATDTGSDPRLADTDGDGFSDGQEVAHNVVNNDGSDPNNNLITPDFEFSPPVAIINLDATALDAGPITVWTNTGGLAGNFGASGLPSVSTQRLVKGVSLDGTNDFLTGPITPLFMTGTNNRTIEAWIYNPAIAPEENIFAWGRRGGPDGSNLSFNHGTDPTFGAVGHWGAGPDIGWNGNISTGRWTFVAYTYDKLTRTAAVYRDGQQANSELITNINTFATNSIPPSPGVQFVAANGLRFRVGAQNEANGDVTPNLRGSMTIARLRVFDEALTAQEISAAYGAEVSLFETRLSVQYNAGSATITWTAIPGRTYAVEATTTLPGTWGDLATGLTTGSYTDTTAGLSDTKFYRVRAQ